MTPLQKLIDKCRTVSEAATEFVITDPNQIKVGDTVRLYDQVWPKDTAEGEDWNWFKDYDVVGVEGNIFRMQNRGTSLSAHYKQCRGLKSNKDTQALLRIIEELSGALEFYCNDLCEAEDDVCAGAPTAMQALQAANKIAEEIV